MVLTHLTKLLKHNRRYAERASLNSTENTQPMRVNLWQDQIIATVSIIRRGYWVRRGEWGYWWPATRLSGASLGSSRLKVRTVGDWKDEVCCRAANMRWGCIWRRRATSMSSHSSLPLLPPLVHSLPASVTPTYSLAITLLYNSIKLFNILLNSIGKT